MGRGFGLGAPSPSAAMATTSGLRAGGGRRGGGVVQSPGQPHAPLEQPEPRFEAARVGRGRFGGRGLAASPPVPSGGAQCSGQAPFLEVWKGRVGPGGDGELDGAGIGPRDLRMQWVLVWTVAHTVSFHPAHSWVLQASTGLLCAGKMGILVLIPARQGT